MQFSVSILIPGYLVVAIFFRIKTDMKDHKEFVAGEG